ncbi:MAG TPA: glycosyltransferase, partial [Anaerolineales bacterium]|nr:glycosyltransferase [Anaerolineales bacterium]
MLPKKKILILTADTGFGHRSAATAIAAAIPDNCGLSYECQIINPVDDPRAPEIIRRPQVDYDWTIQNHPGAYRLSYRISDSNVASMVVQEFIADLMVPLFQDILKTYRPDAVISTYPLYNAALGLALQRNNLDIPFFVIITNLAHVHHAWFQPGPDKFFVATEEARREAVLSDVPPKDVLVTGLPVDPRIVHEKRSKTALRQSLGWNPDLLTVLVVGSKRVKDLFDKLEVINTFDDPLQLVIVAGGNEALFQTARAARWNIPIFCYNYVRNLPQMLHAADLLIAKAGGLITSEALACGLPIIFTEALPGQETGNVEYVRKHSAGMIAKTPADLKETLSAWIKKDGTVLAEFTRNARALGKPNAAYQITREVWKAISERDRRRVGEIVIQSQELGALVWESKWHFYSTLDS